MISVSANLSEMHSAWRKVRGTREEDQWTKKAEEEHEKAKQPLTDTQKMAVAKDELKAIREKVTWQKKEQFP